MNNLELDIALRKTMESENEWQILARLTEICGEEYAVVIMSAMTRMKQMQQETANETI